MFLLLQHIRCKKKKGKLGLEKMLKFSPGRQSSGKILEEFGVIHFTHIFFFPPIPILPNPLPQSSFSFIYNEIFDDDDDDDN